MQITHIDHTIPYFESYRLYSAKIEVAEKEDYLPYLTDYFTTSDIKGSVEMEQEKR